MKTTNRPIRVFLLITFFSLCFYQAAAAHQKVVVVPLSTKSVNKSLLPVAIASINSAGGISQGFGVVSVTRAETGVYDVEIENSISNANPIVLITPFTVGFGSPEIAGYEATESNTFRVVIQDATGTAQSSAFSFSVYNIP